MSSKWKIAIALLVALVVLVILVAPGVDLPATVLQRAAYALVFLLLFRLVCLPFRSGRSLPAPMACANGPPSISFARRGFCCSPLRC